MIAAIVRFFKWLFHIKEKPPAAVEVLPVDRRERVVVRRRTPARVLFGPFFIPSGQYREKKETAYIEARTPKGAHVETAGGIRMHRKMRDIIFPQMEGRA